jgi:hypothetical protein
MQDPRFGSGGALATSIANAIAAGATEAENTNPGAVAAQDVRNPHAGIPVSTAAGTVPTTTTTPTVEAGLITQAQNPPMYQGHQEAAAAAGVGGLNAFGQDHKDWIESNKAQMIALGITPSHKDADGNLTGKYSSADWNAFQIALGNQASNTNDETIEMEEVVTGPSGYTGMNESIQAGIGTQAPQYTGMTEDIQANIPMSAGHPDWGPGAAPNAGQQYTSGVTHPDWGTQLPPNAGQQYTGEAPLPGYGQEMFSQTYAPSYGQEMFGGQSQPWVEGQRPTPSNYEQASRWASGSFPVYGPQASGLSYAPESGSLSSAPPSGQRTLGGEGPINQETVLGYQPAYNTPGNIGTYGANIYSPMGETSEVGGQLMSTEVLQETISPNLNIEELRNTAISSGGTKQQRRAALSKAGMNKEMLDNMSDVDVAIWNYAIMEGSTEGLQEVTFASLLPRVQELKIKFNSGAGAL